ncbi:MAG TPA: IPTL-CTERM sorting domain-containing protein, partial [Thermoanaerobaculia bacterium]|nr:IPTL-CTERM sorting domain-containing protein [Thermoanaerobaculia bacterium]
SHPVLTGITESGLENWGSSTHLEFSSVPGDFRVLVTENDQGDAVLVVRDQVVIVPTLSQWSLILLTLLLGSLGLVIVRRS